MYEIQYACENKQVLFMAVLIQDELTEPFARLRYWSFIKALGLTRSTVVPRVMVR